jgi:hypothetical protein
LALSASKERKEILDQWEHLVAMELLEKMARLAHTEMSARKDCQVHLVNV